MKTTFNVRQTFETFGDPCPENFPTLAEAEIAATELSEAIAKSFYKQDAEGAIIEFSTLDAGCCNEIKFHEDLADAAGATEEAVGRMPWEEMVRRIRNAVIEIVEVPAGVEPPNRRNLLPSAYETFKKI